MLDVQLQGQPVINALLRSAKKPASIRVNGQPDDPAYDQAAQNIWLSLRAEPSHDSRSSPMSSSQSNRKVTTESNHSKEHMP
jgi:hypothetical protein